MKIFRNFLKKGNSKKETYFWTVVGGGIYSFTSVLLLAITTRIIGETGAGVFSLAYSTAQMLLTIALFDIRGFQVTDVNEKYSFCDYFFTRIITCLFSIIVGVIWIVIRGYSVDKAFLFLFVTGMKLLEAISDVYEGFYQQRGRMDIAGKTVFLKMLFSLLGFGIALVLTRNIYIAVFCDVAIYLVLLLAVDIPLKNEILREKTLFSLKRIKDLMREGFPLFINSFLLIYIYNLPKYAIDEFLSDKYLAYYSALFMPASIINLLRGFTFKPVMSDLASYWNKRDYNKIVKVCRNQVIIIFIISTSVLICSNNILISILSLVYGIDLLPYKITLQTMLLGGSINAFATMLNYFGVILRKQKYFAFVYIFTAMCSKGISNLLVIQKGLNGAALNYLFSMLLLCFGSLLVLFLSIKNVWRKENG